MLLDVLERSPETLIYNENNRHAFANYRIRDVVCRLKLIGKARYPAVIFKPLNDTHEIERLMKDHPDCKVLWMYRGYQDVVNSAYRKWENFAYDAFQRAVITDDWAHIPYAARDARIREVIRNYFNDGMGPFSAWALEWYLINKIFFDFELDRMTERVLLIRYEAVVKGHEMFDRIFKFISVPFKSSYVSRVFPNSIAKQSFPEIDPQISLICEEMMRRLDDIRIKQWFNK